ncbi:VOC family protein [Roseibium sp.]|uniref:VOC family protein n=1 Tax=Roseibium sp. TaxID=1936156 RepID=UPI00329A6A73
MAGRMRFKMFSHVMIGANDVEAMVAFYDVVLGTLGLARDPLQPADSPAGFIWQRRGERWPQFALGRPFDGRPATAGNGVQISFAAASRQHVLTAWQSAMGNGGLDEGEPGVRPQYSEDFFAAYCRDPEGNKLCFVYAGDLP